MTALDTRTTVGQLVAGRPSRARVFEKYGIDYCCGGNRALEEVCQSKAVPLAQLEADLAEADRKATSPGEEQDWVGMPLHQLIDHLLTTHHEYLKQEMPRLGQLAAKVDRVHGENHPELHAIAETYQRLVQELMPHMQKEEMILFPLIRQMDLQGGSQGFHCGSVANPIQVMEYEHEVAGELLQQLRELTGGFQVPDDACNSYRALYSGLEELEFDTHLHISKENTYLFPRAIATEYGGA